MVVMEKKNFVTEQVAADPEQNFVEIEADSNELSHDFPSQKPSRMIDD